MNTRFIIVDYSNIIHNPRVAFTVNDKTFKDNARIVYKDKGSKLAAVIKLAAEISNLTIVTHLEEQLLI